MYIHHIQKTIIEKLAKADNLSFSELKPQEIENKLFTYHLKQTITNRFVKKNRKGQYELTATGRKMWKRVSLAAEDIAKRALSVIYVAVRNQKGQWLIYTRKTHPFLGYSAFPHLIPKASHSALQIVKEYLDELDSTCKPIVRASGFFRMFTTIGEIEGFTNFTLVYCEVKTEDILASDDISSYTWMDTAQLESARILPNMPSLLCTLESTEFSFIDQELTLHE